MGGLKQKSQAPAVDRQLFEYLNSLLQQVEASSGTPEVELRSKIEALRTETQKVPSASSSSMTEIDVASKLDQLSEKLASVNQLLAEVESDPDAKGLLSGSADLWMPVITATTDERRATLLTAPNSETPSSRDATK